MFIPKGAKPQEKEIGKWGGLYVKHDGIELWGLAKLGTKATPAEIEKFGEKITNIPAKFWKNEDEGSGKGWEWFKSVQAKNDSTVVFGGYGVGPKGSYLLIIKTTSSDLEEHNVEYMKWYNSIKLN
ncbi:MAG: hypothetical protein OEV44_14590 [Spirochaetota bacterium]|nr:hypothetical protein [Spirochaetota bacterium]